MKLSDDYSKEICDICNNQLSSYTQFKKYVIKSQTTLYQIAKRARILRYEELQIENPENFKIEPENFNDIDFEVEVFPRQDVEYVTYDNELPSGVGFFLQDDVADNADLLDLENHKRNIEKRRVSDKTG